METGGPPDLTAEQTAGCSSVRDPVSNTKVGRNEERHSEVWPLVDMWGDPLFLKAYWPPVYGDKGQKR